MPTFAPPQRRPARRLMPRNFRHGQSGQIAKPVVALLALIILAAAATAITYFVTQSMSANATAGATPAASAEAPEAPPAPVIEPTFVALEPFTVTLSNEEMERLLHVGISLKTADDVTVQRIQRFMPEVRSRFLMILSEQSPADINSLQAKQRLATDLKRAANAPFAPNQGGQNVSDVLFTAFVVQ